MLSRHKLFQYLRYYQDEIMVSFIYLAWGAMMQAEIYVNTGQFPTFNIFTTGTPLVIALGFYGLKQTALFIRSNLEIERLRKEEQTNEST